jgi:hypothetical protein
MMNKTLPQQHTKILIRLKPGWPVMEATVVPKPSRLGGIILRTPGGHEHLLKCVHVVDTDMESVAK